MAGLHLLKARLASLPRRVWVTAGAVVLTAGVAAGLVFLLKPGSPVVVLDASRPSYFHPDGLVISLPEGTASARVRISTIPRESFLSDQAGAAWIDARAALPANTAPLSPVYLLNIEKGSVQAEMAIPNGAEPLILLDLYAWDASRGQWTFVPSRQRLDQQTIAFQPQGDSFTVMAVHAIPDAPAIGVVFSEGAAPLNAAYDTAIIDGVFINASGQLEGAPAQSDAPRVMPLVANRMGGFGAYGDPNERVPIIEGLMSLVTAYNGVLLDFEPGPGYVEFVSILAERVHPHGKQVEVVIRGTPDNYDVAGLALYADRIWFAPGDDPNAYLPSSPAANSMRNLVSQVARGQLGVLVSERTVDVANNATQPLTLAEALDLFGHVQVSGGTTENVSVPPGSTLPFRLSGQVASMGFDEALGTNYLTHYDQSGQLHYVYFSSARSLNRKLEWARSYGPGALAIDGIGQPDADPGLAEALAAFLNEQPASPPEALEINWRIESSSGASLNEASGDLSLIQYLWEAASEPGSYVVRAVIRGIEGDSDRGQVQVEVAEKAPTPTPSPTPTATGRAPTPTPNPNATPRPQPTAGPITGPIVPGQFELGGQTQSFGHAELMQYAGMTWVKFQHKWNPGDDAAGAVGGRIADAHGRGFKVLLSIPGPEHPSSIDYAAYVNFLGAVAALGPDAIEVWNEMNLPREWPLNDINGASYVTNMLAPSYQAIKAANPNVIVISGAPAPTGVYGGQGCGPLACDELLFIGQMRDAGAAQYADCMGIHYNEGIIPPNQTSGDPRDAYYTRYFYGMVNTYWATFGKPLCFTELGYLSPEGYGELPAAFAWAGGTSVAEQAQWLAEAAVLSSQSGRVRLMIIFNVDFTVYGADPQGGYAIVRPGGGCPACDALNAVKP